MSPILTKSYDFSAKLRILLVIIYCFLKYTLNALNLNAVSLNQNFNMKKNLCIAFVMLIALSSCDAIDELTKFDLDYEINFSIPPTTIINIPFDLITPDITTNSDASFESNNTRENLIESIKLKQLRLTLNAPDDGNFNFLKEVHVYIEAEGIDEVEIANVYDLENNDLSTLELDVLDEELKEFIKKDNYNLRVTTITDETINETHDITVSTIFRVDAEIFGI